MSRIYTVQFFEGFVPFPTAIGTYTVPDGYVAVIRDVSGVLTPAGDDEVALRGVTSLDTQWMYAGSLATDAYVGVQWSGRIAIPAGESFSVNFEDPDEAGFGSCVCSGYLLVL